MATRTIVKRVKNAVLFSDGTIRIDGVRGSYVHADKPYKGKTDDGGTEAVAKFSIVGIMPKATHEEARDLIIECIQKLLKDNKDAKVAKDKRYIRDGDDQEKDEYVDSWTVSAREERRPTCRDRSGEIVAEIEDVRNIFRSGYWFNILIRPWYQDNKYGKRVNAGLVGIQFVKKDKEFGEGSIDDTDAWEVVEGGDDGLGGGDEDDGM